MRRGLRTDVLRAAAVGSRVFTTTTVFGIAAEVTLSELMGQAFRPADEATAQALRSTAQAG